jgi:hypothetical protein
LTVFCCFCEQPEQDVKQIRAAEHFPGIKNTGLAGSCFVHGLQNIVKFHMGSKTPAWQAAALYTDFKTSYNSTLRAASVYTDFKNQTIHPAGGFFRHSKKIKQCR